MHPMIEMAMLQIFHEVYFRIMDSTDVEWLIVVVCNGASLCCNRLSNRIDFRVRKTEPAFHIFFQSEKPLISVSIAFVESLHETVKLLISSVVGSSPHLEIAGCTGHSGTLFFDLHKNRIKCVNLSVNIHTIHRINIDLFRIAVKSFISNINKRLCQYQHQTYMQKALVLLL